MTTRKTSAPGPRPPGAPGRGEAAMENVFTHITKNGKLRMVDISAKRVTRRSSTATCVVHTNADLSTLSSPLDVDVQVASQLAGIQAAKKTADLIPLCHPLSLSDIDVSLVERADHVEITATVSANYRTGVEMEALSACAIAALNLLGSLKEVDPMAWMGGLCVMSKTGGKSGPWGRAVAAPSPDPR